MCCHMLEFFVCAGSACLYICVKTLWSKLPWDLKIVLAAKVNVSGEKGHQNQKQIRQLHLKGQAAGFNVFFLLFLKVCDDFFGRHSGAPSRPFKQRMLKIEKGSHKLVKQKPRFPLWSGQGGSQCPGKLACVWGSFIVEMADGRTGQNNGAASL